MYLLLHMWTHTPANACVFLYIYIIEFRPLGALKSQLGGTHRRSLLFYIVKVYCVFTSSHVDAHSRTCIYIYIYIYIFKYNRVPPLGALKSQLGGTYRRSPVVLYRQGLLCIYFFLYGRTLPHIYIYIYKYNRVPPLGALKSQLGGTYRRSLLLYIVTVYCVFTSSYVDAHSRTCIYIYIIESRPWAH